MPSLVRTLAILEFELDAKAGVERTFIARVRVAVDRRRTYAYWLEEVGITRPDCTLFALIEAKQGTLVADVEQVSNQTQTLSLGDSDRIVNVSIDAAEVGCAAQRATSRGAIGCLICAERNFTRVGIHRVGIQVVDGNPRLEVNG